MALLKDGKKAFLRHHGNPSIHLKIVAEFTIEDGIDSYDVSLVDGFNLPLSIGPQELSRECQWTSCPGNINAVCPPELAVKGQDGSVIACKSACKAFGSPQYFCAGAYRSSNFLPTNYSKIFKGQCPQAYSYAHDDHRSTLNCRDSLNYLIKFSKNFLMYKMSEVALLRN
ncbi:hypothetical protein MLD38_035414 [Melastoma candidum]|uniref:Uncharacterized protein n=1 Tax=Melastoma candidum TaxID=119954 RepID=A0ACB9LGM1_9MYRT|nr:hypothetical protein MLD38_035414 [Melastoma candidum]